MALSIRVSKPQDRAGILQLMTVARGDSLTEQERSERGFVQGRMDEDLLVELEQGPGVLVAVDEAADGTQTVAGFAMTSLPQHTDPGPRGRLAAFTDEHHPNARWAMYGPLAIDPSYQGNGLTRKLLQAVGRNLANYDLGVAFVETTNRRSMQIHEHYPFTREGEFTFTGLEFAVFSFVPTVFVTALSK